VLFVIGKITLSEAAGVNQSERSDLHDLLVCAFLRSENYGTSICSNRDVESEVVGSVVGPHLRQKNRCHGLRMHCDDALLVREKLLDKLCA
jgi:hypothetical protein